jgi:hypothetical protein
MQKQQRHWCLWVCDGDTLSGLEFEINFIDPNDSLEHLIEIKG